MMHLFRYISRFFLLLTLISLLGSCGVNRQVQQVAALSKCDFRITTVDNVNLAGVNLSHIHSVTDIGFTDIALLMGGFASPVYPLSLTLNVEARNPNDREAGLNRLEWILFIDDIQMTSGVIATPFTIPAKGAAGIPVDVGMDLKKVLSGKSASAMINFCVNMAGAGNTPTRFKIKLKPSLFISGKQIAYPGWITVNTTYNSK